MNYIVYEQKGMVAVLTISREKALNALNSEVLAELEAAVDAIDLETVRCLVITGAGERSFVAGADIGEMSKLTKAEGEAFGKKGNDVFRKIEALPIPVIAAAVSYTHLSHRRRAGILSFVLVFKMQAPTYPSLYCATLIMIGTFYE